VFSTHERRRRKKRCLSLPSKNRLKKPPSEITQERLFETKDKEIISLSLSLEANKTE
tara:strand:- start:74 stop:244 length:171 start_codon:yes stop_codon:yes gene_type:complete